MTHSPLTTRQIAAADRMHARGRQLVREMIADYTAHTEACDTESCRDAAQEPRTVADMAVELWEAVQACGHPKCFEGNVKALCEALSYVTVRHAEGRPLLEHADPTIATGADHA